MIAGAAGAAGTIVTLAPPYATRSVSKRLGTQWHVMLTNGTTMVTLHSICLDASVARQF